MNPSHQPKSLLSRRRFLQAGGIGALSMGLPGMVAARFDGDRPMRGAAEKSCIFVLLCGGPSHLDTWDLKPEGGRRTFAALFGRSRRAFPACASAS